MATPVAAEVVGLQDLASALSLLWLIGTVIPTLCSPLGSRFTDQLVVSEAIALRLKENAIAAGKTGADIYRPTIGYAGSMIFIGGVLLIVCSIFDLFELISRAQKFGSKIKGMEKWVDIGSGKRLEIILKCITAFLNCILFNIVFSSNELFWMSKEVLWLSREATHLII